MKALSRAQLFATPWTASYQVPPSMGFSRQEDWSGVPLPSPLFAGLSGLRSYKVILRGMKGKGVASCENLTWPGPTFSDSLSERRLFRVSGGNTWSLSLSHSETLELHTWCGKEIIFKTWASRKWILRYWSKGGQCSVGENWHESETGGNNLKRNKETPEVSSGVKRERERTSADTCPQEEV